GNIVEAIASLRRWKKQLGRAAEMGISLPDGSVLLMALEGATKQITEGNKDISFKLNMAKNELGLPHKPTLSNVLTYSDHIAAELQQVIPFNKEQTAKLKAASADSGSPTSSAPSPSGKGQGQKQPCKFWLTDEGCWRGANCKYGHVFQSKEDKSDKRARCWSCGATTHRQADCPTRRGGKRGKKDSGGALNSNLGIYSYGNECDFGAPYATGPSVYDLYHLPNLNSGEVRELAEQFLAKIKRLAPVQAQTDDAVMDLELLLRSQGFEQHQGMALLDSGASHAYRAPRTVEETRTAKRVRVQLADGRAVYPRQNPGGTLLSEEEGGGTILPLGSLVESLGCRLEWTRRHGLRVHHPRYGLLPTKLIGNTPVLRETEALQLIADMEQVEMDKLEANVTEGAIRTLSVDEAPATWLDHLEEFISKGDRACLRRMLLDEESPVKALSEQEVTSLLGVEERLLLSDDAGAHYLKALPVNRAMRKRLLRTRWVVHLYNGDEQGPEFARAESDDVTVIRMDMKDSKAYDLRFANGAVRALMWAAARGQIEAVLGAPPRGTEHSSLLFKRMMLLWLVANSGAALDALCAPSFTLELPTWHHFWTSSAWLSFRDELRFLKYHSVACQGNLYFLASSLEMSDGLDVDEAMRSDMRRHEAVLSKLIGNRELNAKDLEYWQRHINNNHLPYDVPFPDEEEEEIEPELDPFEEDEGVAVPDEEEDDEQKEMNKRFQKIYEGIGDNLEYQTLHFAVPMNTRTSKEVRSKIQQIYLQLRQHGLPLVRIHSDRGLELKAKETRAWMADRDILATTGESQQPQQNGRAEALVRTIKRRVKTLLRSAGLPMACWPSAAEFSARRQRDLALGNYEDKDLPYGAPTHVKYKRFGEGGRYDLLERWKEGVFVGYSNDVARGRVVRHSDGSYTTSVHIRPYLIDTEDLVEFGPHEVEVPVPERRVRGKASVAQLLQEPINDLDRAAKKYIDEGKYDLGTVVELWEMLRSKARRTTRNAQGEGLQWMVGQYTHGGQCGVVNDTNAYPFVTLYLVKAFKELTGVNDFTSLLITEVAYGWKQTPDPTASKMSGDNYRTGDGDEGGYTNYNLETTAGDDHIYSKDFFHDLDINEAVLFLVKEAEGEKRQRTQQISEELPQLQEDVLGRLKERREWLQEFLAEEEILAEEIGVVGESINEEIMGINDVVRDLIQDVEKQVTEVEKKCESLYLRVANVDDDKEIGDIEEYLANLKEDLEVTLDVPLDQVKHNLDRWVEPMAKELANLEEKTGAIERWSIAEARKLESEGRLILIPGKVVCTVKPPAPLGPGSPPSTTPRWKRKARVVICGNLAGQSHDPNDLFAAGASVEGLRLALAIAVSMGWCVASTDVSAAFLQAKWPRDRPTYGVLPPKVLQQAGLVEHGVVFIVRRALYGLRASPALWAAHRTEVLEKLSVDTKEGSILVTYVDDLLYLAARDIITSLHEKIGSIWPCSELEFATEGLRYLGMELVQEESTVTLSQEAYVDNLVRLHGLDPLSKAGLPCPKEWLQDEDFNDVAENFNEEELKRAQKVTGECLWLAYRTRPDILFVTNYLAAMTSRKPVKVYNVGLKVISYLNATAGLKLKVACSHSRTNAVRRSRTNAVHSRTDAVHSRTDAVHSRTDAVHSRTVRGVTSEGAFSRFQGSSGWVLRCVLCPLRREKLWLLDDDAGSDPGVVESRGTTASGYVRLRGGTPRRIELRAASRIYDVHGPGAPTRRCPTKDVHRQSGSRQPPERIYWKLENPPFANSSFVCSGQGEGWTCDCGTHRGRRSASRPSDEDAFEGKVDPPA
ncbi:GIP, partial [Symbiodinium necroappetens]